MKSINKIMFLVLGLCLAFTLQAQPKREFRSAWLTTVWAIDWPKSHSQSTEAGQQKQQNELRAIVDSLAEANMNAVFFQVRGFSDAMYKSKYEPWSQYLTGTRGGEPTYDPLQLLIEYAHSKGIEVHAWVNPYRYGTSSVYGKTPNDYHYTHPEWLVKCGDITILNPSMPEVRKQICCVIADMVENYDLDGVLFDDYFYQSGYELSYDNDLYQNSGTTLSRADWRRAQVNLMVRNVRDTIKATKPWVTFGIGPAGVAGSYNTSAPVYGVEPCPSPSGDWQYNGIYSDPLAWYNEKTIDYMAPQIYWKIDSYTNYDLLSKWWSDMACHFGRHMYVSHSLSALKPDGAQLASTEFYADEIGAQTELNRLYDRMGAPGSCWYGLGTGLNTKGFIQYIKNNVYNRPAVVPQMSWYTTDDCLYVSNMRKNGQKLMWDAPAENLRYVVYCIPTNPESTIGLTSTSEYLLGTAYTNSFQVPTVSTPAGYTYAVAVLDRYGNEYPARRYNNKQWGKTPEAQLISPIENAYTLLPSNATWHAVEGADSYFFQLSKSPDFATLDYEYELTDTTFYLGKVYWLNSEGTFYWRVRTRSIDKEDSFSKIQSFHGSYFKIQYPLDGDTTDYTLTFVCDSVQVQNVEYTFELATTSAFNKADIICTAVTNVPRYTLPDTLIASRNYYLRVSAQFEDKYVLANIVRFRTRPQDVPIPVIISPTDGEHITGKQLYVEWKEQASSGFRVEISIATSFPGRYTQRGILEGTDIYSYTFEDVEPGTWYIRVMAMAEGGYTDSSEIITVYMEAATATEEVEVSTTPVKVLQDGNIYILRNGKKYNMLGNYAQ